MSATKGLLPDDRRHLILEYLTENNTARVADLAERLGVTAVTIRRDLESLSETGDVKRIHGGVTLARPFQPAQKPVEYSLGMVVPSLDYYWPSVARGAKDQAGRADMKIILRESAYNSPDQDRKQIQHLVEHNGVQGLVLTVDVRDSLTLDLLQELTDQGLVIVLVERNASLPRDGVPLPAVTSDHRSGAMLAVRTLADLGHERIAIVAPNNSPTSPHLQSGWEQACQDRNMRPASTWTMLVDNSTPETLLAEVNRVLDICGAEGITGLLVHADPEANLLVQTAQQRGLVVPGDLSVMAYDDEVASLFTPALTAIRPPRYTIGETAVEILVGRLKDPTRPVPRVILSPRLTIREST